MLAERLVQQPADAPLASGEPDRMAAAAMRILRRGTLGIDVLEPWVHRLGAAGNPFGGPVDHDPFAAHRGAAGVPARAVRPALARRPSRPTVRSDLLLVVIEALRMTNAPFLRCVPASSRPLASAP